LRPGGRRIVVGMTQRVLVTGGSGFIAGHCIRQLREQGYEVRATSRSPHPDFVQADLLSDTGWAAAAEGCDYVLHVASPVRPGHVANEDDLIVPAREGTLRVLRAARDAGVKRVVLTSAFHAVGFGHPHTDHVFTEEDWSVLNGPGMDAYGRSKVLAERAAWEFATGAGLELTTMLPVAVMGPVTPGGAVSGANHIVQRMLDGQMPGFPDMHIPIVDVRDVASAHVAAMTIPKAGSGSCCPAGRSCRCAGSARSCDRISARPPRGCRPAPSRTWWSGSAPGSTRRSGRSPANSATSRRSPTPRPAGSSAGNRGLPSRRSSPRAKPS
jgi:nucleoside-diphosphate-sugar epimerase